MNISKTRHSIGKRFLDFIDVFNCGSGDYMFDQAGSTAVKVKELEQRIEKLEMPQAVLRELRHGKAV
jgi:hypothetical protein